MSLLAFGALALPHAGPAIANAPSPAVQLLVPIESGHELGLVLPKAPQAQLVRVNDRDFVSLGRFQDARVAYRLGRTFQRHTQLPFELAYDPDHPDAGGTWLARETQGTHNETLAKTFRAPSEPAHENPVNPGGAELLGGALIAGRTQHQWLSAIPALPPLPTSVVGLGQQRQHLIQAVAIAPVTRPSLATVNPDLHYLFVRLQTTKDLVALKQHATVTEVTERNGQLLARVGAYYPTHRGTQLLKRQSQLLSGLGFHVTVLTSSA